MLISVSGSQGCGKTTTLNAIAQLGYHVIERKTSRSILSDWGVTLAEVNNNHELAVKFQNEILARKLEDEASAVNSPDVWFTERTFIDLAVYNNFALAANNEYSVFVNEYYDKCVTATQTYQHVFYLTAGHFVVEHDHVRGSNKHYSHMVDLVMRDAYLSSISPSSLTIVDSSSLSQRISLVQKVVHSLTRNG